MERFCNSLYNAVSPSEAEAILRSRDFPVDADALTYVLDFYFKSGNEDSFYDLMLDFYEVAQTTEWFPKDEAKREMFIEGIYGLMYNKKDADRAVRAAAILTDYRKNKRDNFGIFAIFGDLRKLCGNPVSNSTYFIIVKEAISSAVSIIENSVDELPSEEDVSVIGRVVIYLAVCCSDREFALSIAERLAVLYDDATVPQQIILRFVLPEMERAFSSLGGAMAMIDGKEVHVITRTLADCKAILFNEKTPTPLDGQDTLKVLTGDIATNEYLIKANERSQLATDIANNRENFEYDWKPAMRERYEILVDYFTSVDPMQIQQYEKTEHICLIIGLIALWRDFDFDYVFPKIKPYAEELFAIMSDCSHLPANSVYMIATAYHTLGDVYAIDEDWNKVYECFVRFLRYSNIYLKRICMESDHEFFLATVEDEYFYYHDVTNNAMTLLDEHDFPLGCVDNRSVI